MAFFELLMDSHVLLNIYSTKIVPTWRNKRTGEDALARRLDHFLIKATLFARFDRIHQLMGSGGLSNHSPIFMGVMESNHKPNSPFKFNATWLTEANFHKLVHETWTHYGLNNHSSPNEVIACNLDHLKLKTMSWAREKKQKYEVDLLRIEGVLKKMEKLGITSYTNFESKDLLIKLETENICLLRWKEESLRLNIIAIWLKAGVENSNFFQQYVKRRKNTNNIWALRADWQGGQHFQPTSRCGHQKFLSYIQDAKGSLHS